MGARKGCPLSSLTLPGYVLTHNHIPEAKHAIVLVGCSAFGVVRSRKGSSDLSIFQKAPWHATDRGAIRPVQT